MNSTTIRSTKRWTCAAVLTAAVAATGACTGDDEPVDQAHLGQPAVAPGALPSRTQPVACRRAGDHGRPRMPWDGRLWLRPRVDPVG